MPAPLRASLLVLALAACGGAPPPSRTPERRAAGPASTGTTAVPPAPPPGPSLAVLLRPVAAPAPMVHVEIELVAREGSGASASTWRIARSDAARVKAATARDTTGDIAVRVAAAAPAVDLILARAPDMRVHLSYDVQANDGAPDDPLDQLVLDDRFRGAGEGLIALPETVEDAALPITLRIDGDALRASGCASSLGVGCTRQTRVRPRALRYSSFLAGSLGAAFFDDPSSGRDDAAWLGYTAFDPRPASAEIAQVRTALGELWKSRDEPPWTYLFVSQSRPIGSFSTTARAGSVLVQVGPAEPWSGALRLSVAQQLTHRWIGGELRMATDPGKDAEGWWFADGVARHVAMRVLARLGLLTPADVREAVTGELSVLATTPFVGKTNADLATLATRDDVARAALMARGALYAAREGAVLRARTKGERGLEAALLGLLTDVRAGPPRAIPTSAWIEALAKDDPDAARSFDAVIARGAAVTLPDGALGPCYSAGTGEYVAFDPGFDVVATSETRDGHVVGLRPDGPAAKAGLREGDLVETLTEREGDASVPVKIVATRAGSKVTVTFTPRGVRGRGQTWTRNATPEARCTEAWE